MPNDDVSGPPHAFAPDRWAGETGGRWIAGLDGLEAMLAPVGEALLARAAAQPGERVVDIGCGGGWTTLRLGEAVGEAGLVVGLDISAGLLEIAARRAREAGLDRVRFEVGDAAVARPADAPFDRLVSRFGCMFFPEPYAAFANLRRMVRPGGRLDIAVWAPAAENPWVAETMAAVKRHMDAPAPPPRTPGPFALGEEDYLRDLLGAAGFSDVDVAAWTGPQHLGGPGAGPEQAADFALRTMHVGDVVKRAAPEVQAAVRADLVETLRAHATPAGVALGSKALFATAAVAR